MVTKVAVVVSWHGPSNGLPSTLLVHDFGYLLLYLLFCLHHISVNYNAYTINDNPIYVIVQIQWLM